MVLKTEAAIVVDPSMMGQSFLDPKMIGKIAIYSKHLAVSIFAHQGLNILFSPWPHELPFY